jgi:lysyl endopeptidase
MKREFFIILLFIFIPFFSLSQLCESGIPLGLSKFDNSTLKEIQFEPPDLTPIFKYNSDNQHKSLRFSEKIPIKINPIKEGDIEKAGNGFTISRIRLKAEGAKSIQLVFSPFKVPSGLKVFVYDPSGQYILGAFTEKNNHQWNSLAIEPISGEELIVEIQLPPFCSFEPQIEISELWYDFIGIQNILKDGYFGHSDDCNFDIKCSPGDNWQIEKHSVCRIIAGGSLCTGTLVNNTRKDAKAYFLTANHCINSESVANNMLAFFNYESSTCNGTDGFINQTISGSSLKATTANLDFCLLELSTIPPPPYNSYYSGWSLNDTPASETAVIHHPMGDVKKISIDNDATVTGNYGGTYDENSHWKILNWEYGTTEGGSSGSPLFNEYHQIIGTLTGGEASCQNSVNDYFSKLSLAWNSYPLPNEQLKTWLDPDNQNPNHLTGYKPFSTTSKPVINFSVSQSTINAGGFVDFIDLSTNNPTSWNWSFPGASPDNSQSQYPTNIIYPYPGVYPVSLTASNSNGSNSKTIDSFIHVLNGCNFQNNISDTETLALYGFSSGEWGYWTGHNQYGFSEICEKFTNSSGYWIHGLSYLPGRVFASSASSKITFTIRKGGALPGIPVYSKEILLNTINSGIYNTIEINPPVYVGPDFFAGFQIYYSQSDTFALVHSLPRGSGGNNTCFVRQQSGWIPINENNSDFTISLAIKPFTCSLNDINDVQTESSLSLFPNPFSEKIVITNSDISDFGQISIYDITGREVYRFQIDKRATQEIDLSFLETGIYTATAFGKSKKESFKLLKSN